MPFNGALTRLLLVRLSGWPNQLEAQNGGDVGLEQRDVLSPLALTAGQVSAGLDSGRLELVDDVGDRLLRLVAGRGPRRRRSRGSW